MMSEENSLLLPVEISIENVCEWHKTLLEVLNNSDSISIDASEICRIDTAGIQLLTVFINELSLADKQFKWQSVSEALSTTARQLGLTQKLLLEKLTWDQS